MILVFSNLANPADARQSDSADFVTKITGSGGAVAVNLRTGYTTSEICLLKLATIATSSCSVTHSRKRNILGCHELLKPSEET